MLQKEMQKIINFVIQLDIDQIETFRGYHGDNVLKVLLSDKDVRDEIDRFLDNMGLKYKNDYDISEVYGGSYRVFVGIEDTTIYSLK